MFRVDADNEIKIMGYMSGDIRITFMIIIKKSRIKFIISTQQTLKNPKGISDLVNSTTYLKNRELQFKDLLQRGQDFLYLRIYYMFQS